ncbi:DUF1667 domain-containing protein [Gehongia tenuis]|uniref:DUF1667 domain-containing protein n=1 Tax=Gehongia tenuis TaxID=2763655 RepID=A0A926D203_9FIRM|nr:DUF1667 domain-containing protein [Gehongia tenuis]MBC8530935.1 DUF1667 domain-containing protein [Gehongia tenuis]
MICIMCPIGCQLTVENHGEELKVSGQGCPRGEVYAKDEITLPKRVLTTSVPVLGGDMPLLSVKTERAVPKMKLGEILRELRGIAVKAPVRVGDVVLKNAAGTGVDVVATRRID